MSPPTLSKQLQRARKLLEALQQGIDPRTNEELPKNSLVNDIEVNRAIGTSILAVDQLAGRIQRRKHLPDNVGRSWTKQEEDYLTRAFTDGESVDEIASRCRRTVRAIETRLQKLGLMSASEATTNTSFIASTKEDNKNE